MKRTKPMRTYIVMFKRSNDDDLEFAFKNRVSGMTIPEALVHQCELEVAQAKKKTKSKVRESRLCAIYSKKETTVFVRVDTKTHSTLQKLRKHIQRWYDVGGMSGWFDILAEGSPVAVRDVDQIRESEQGWDEALKRAGVR